jgi:hypothetical protein
VPTAEKELKNLQTVVAEAKKEGKTNKEIAEVVEAIKDTAFATSAVTRCAVGIANGIASAGGSIPLTVLACGGAVEKIKDMMKKYEKDQKERDQIDEDFDRIDHCPVNGSDIDWDRIDIISRTA